MLWRPQSAPTIWRNPAYPVNEFICLFLKFCRLTRTGFLRRRDSLFRFCDAAFCRCCTKASREMFRKQREILTLHRRVTKTTKSRVNRKFRTTYTMASRIHHRHTRPVRDDSGGNRVHRRGICREKRQPCSSRIGDRGTIASPKSPPRAAPIFSASAPKPAAHYIWCPKLRPWPQRDALPELSLKLVGARRFELPTPCTQKSFSVKSQSVPFSL